ncbi:hypothetical protein NL676_015138 [Syzygium grande]|nr:hypothetical protein NL676_015138 [Syzygium grande]
MGGAGGVYKRWVADTAHADVGIDQVMLGLRPIAPKPATEDQGPRGSECRKHGVDTIQPKEFGGHRPNKGFGMIRYD